MFDWPPGAQRQWYCKFSAQTFPQILLQDCILLIFLKMTLIRQGGAAQHCEYLLIYFRYLNAAECSALSLWRSDNPPPPRHGSARPGAGSGYEVPLWPNPAGQHHNHHHCWVRNRNSPQVPHPTPPLPSHLPRNHPRGSKNSDSRWDTNPARPSNSADKITVIGFRNRVVISFHE